MSGEGAQLIYKGATGLERALAHVEGDRLTDINAELIRDIWDAQRVPFALLPYLAWAMGVQYWNDEWSETTKRQWVAIQWLFKSRRGTAWALRTAVDYAGRDVSRWGYDTGKITTRPQKIFSGPSLTREQREAWLAKMPQVRVWRIQEEGFAPMGKSFLGGRGPLRQHNHRFLLTPVLPPGSLQLARDLSIGSPEIGSPAFASLHVPGLNDQSRIPVLGTPALVQKHVLPAAVNLTTLRPRMDWAEFHILTVPGKTVTSPAFGAVDFKQRHKFIDLGFINAHQELADQLVVFGKVAQPRIAQTFTPQSDEPIKSVTFGILKNLNPTGNLSVRLYETTADGRPDSSMMSNILAESDEVLPISIWSHTSQGAPNTKFTFPTPFKPTVGKKYAFVLRSSVYDDVNFFYARAPFQSNHYADGGLVIRDATGWLEPLSYDLSFCVNISASIVTARPIIGRPSLFVNLP